MEPWNFVMYMRKSAVNQNITSGAQLYCPQADLNGSSTSHVLGRWRVTGGNEAMWERSRTGTSKDRGYARAASGWYDLAGVESEMRVRPRRGTMIWLSLSKLDLALLRFAMDKVLLPGLEDSLASNALVVMCACGRNGRIRSKNWETWKWNMHIQAENQIYLWTYKPNIVFSTLGHQ